MKNTLFEIELHPMTGGVERFVKAQDAGHFNWCRGKFGIPSGMNFLSKLELSDNCAKEVFAYFSYLDLEVERRLTDEGLRESYSFKNTGDTVMEFKEGELGIYATFADSTDIAEVALKRRAHSHIWCGGDTAYIHNDRMGGSTDGLGLVLTNGRIIGFEEESGTRDSRGDIVLKLPALTLKGGESYTLEWLVFGYENRKEFRKIIRREGALTLSVSDYHVKRGNTITIASEQAERAVLHDAEVLFSQGKAEIVVDCEGEQRIDIFYQNGKYTFINIFAGERETVDTAAILKRHGVKKLFSRKNSSEPLIEALKNIDWYKKIGDKGYLALAAVDMFRYYRAFRAERFADICLPAEVFKEAPELIPHLIKQAVAALEDKGIFGFYSEVAAFDLLLKAYDVTGNEGFHAAALIRLERLSRFVGTQPDYKAFAQPDLYRNQIDIRIPELIDCGALVGNKSTLAEYFLKETAALDNNTGERC